MPEKDLYIGLMSGTSVNSIDAALIDFTGNELKIVASHEHDIPLEIKHKILEVCTPGENEIEKTGDLDRALGILFAHATDQLLGEAGVSPDDVKAIGSHGQTIRHHPKGVLSDLGFSTQIGDPNTIASLTGITTVADFRRKDVALNGHGAPLAPAFHQDSFSHPEITRCIINIGGMANVTYLPAEKDHDSETIFGFDTGPGNVLMDTWITLEIGKSYDKNGEWAKSGTVNNSLLRTLLSYPYFSLGYPKSTGREEFNKQWLLGHIDKELAPEDIQATLLELTARSISEAVKKHCSKANELYVCGGGAHNEYLMSRIQANCPSKKLATTEELNIHPDWVEACAFAWLAKRTMERLPGNLPEVTGATRPAILGGIFLP